MTLRYGAFSVESVVDWSLDPGFLENGAKSLGHLIWLRATSQPWQKRLFPIGLCGRKSRSHFLYENIDVALQELCHWIWEQSAKKKLGLLCLTNIQTKGECSIQRVNHSYKQQILDYFWIPIFQYSEGVFFVSSYSISQGNWSKV